MIGEVVSSGLKGKPLSFRRESELTNQIPDRLCFLETVAGNCECGQTRKAWSRISGQLFLLNLTRNRVVDSLREGTFCYFLRSKYTLRLKRNR